MNRRYEDVQVKLVLEPKTWLITGVAGFVGSNLLEALLQIGQRVIGIDNFSTGFRKNIDDVRLSIAPELWRNFSFIEGDIREIEVCRQALKGADYVLHQAALGSVPRSIDNPLASNASNVVGFLNMLVAARDEGVRKFVYASSSSVYGDHPALPKVENKVGKPLSPYAVTKYVNELYAEVFSLHYKLPCTGLRYFNVFGPRQDPDGAYAAVIPRWSSAIVNDTDVLINGEGDTSRDFCYVANAIQANVLAACDETQVSHDVFNVAVGHRASLNQLFEMLREAFAARGIRYNRKPVYQDYRPGDVHHSQADIYRIQRQLGYVPTHTVREGISDMVDWHLKEEVVLPECPEVVSSLDAVASQQNYRGGRGFPSALSG